MSPRITFDPELRKELDSGELIFIAAMFYNPSTQGIQYCYADNITQEEAEAVLRAHGCLPPAMDSSK
jgi:hypothetical protein